jgi:hypothetical protein
MRSPRFASLAIISLALTAVAAIDLFAAGPSAAAGVTPEQQMCAATPAQSTTVHTGEVADLAACTIEVTTPGTAYISSSASIYPLAASQIPSVQASIKIDSQIDLASSRTVALGPGTGDGLDRNLSTQRRST